MYYFVERSIAVLKPKQPLLDWVNQTFTDIPQDLTLENIRVDCNSYLIPEVEQLEEGVSFVDDKFVDLFALELSTWSEDETVWPTELTLQMFWEWFDVEIYPTIIDLGLEDAEDGKAPRTVENTIH